MLSLFPDSRSVDPLVDVPAEERKRPDGQPWVATNMVASIDGATAIHGVSGGLGTPSDKLQFRALRSVADAIIVGAATVQAERYRPPQLTESIRKTRRDRGQTPLPLVVVVTSRLQFDLDLPLFLTDDYRPLIATTEQAPPDRLEAVKAQADVVVAGSERVDLKTLMKLLQGKKCHVVLSEGGPSINGQLAKDDLVDEWNLSLSPFLVGGASPRPAHGPPTVHVPQQMRLDRLWQGDDMLFGRWLRTSEPNQRE